ncbi:MAG: biopolymer transporter ExbD [Myxococcaceae bacterium]
MDLGAGGRGKKRTLDTAINLVPFIDLMAVLISFLLLTAAWNQTGKISARQGGGAGEGAAATPVRVVLTGTQFRVALDGAVEELTVARDDRGRLKVETLSDKLKTLQAQLHQRELSLMLGDEVPYDDLVHVMDACVGSGFDDVEVSPI